MRAGFSSLEKRSIAGLSVVIGLRMLGLSMIIPLFSVYAIGLPGSSAFLAGIAFGVYGLTQAMLQIPFGFLSDKFGRKPVVAFGLVLFGVGSVIAAVTDNIYILIAGRFLQGGGAIASACFAWIADLTEESRRNMAMAFMGISIGAGIVTGMIVGPILGAVKGVPFLFWLAAALSMAGMYITIWRMDEAPGRMEGRQAGFSLDPMDFFRMAAKPDLLRLNVTGFMVNICMISTFFIVPLRLAGSFAMGELWKIYLPLSVFGGMAMMFSSRKADSGSARGVIMGALLSLAAAYVLLFTGAGLWLTLAGFAIFFSGFSVLEATLPAAVSKLADDTHKGTIIGVFNLSQFMGTFVGGALAGWLSASSEEAVFAILGVGALLSAMLMGSAKNLKGPAGS